MSWSLRFLRPVELPDGNVLETLHDARAYLLAQPKSRHQDEAFQTALEAVLMAGNGDFDILHANAGMHQLIHGKPQPPEPRPSTTRPWGKVKLLRDR